MKTPVFLGFLLGFVVAIGQSLEDDDPQVVVPEAMKLRLPPYNYMYMYNDNGEAVQLNMHEDHHEGENETAIDLHNRVFFYLYTRKHPEHPKELFVDNADALKRVDFDPAKPTKFVTHGWMNSKRSAACTEIRDAYIEHGDFNVIVVDWSKISYKPYVWASKRVLMVGKYVASMINFLEQHGMDLSQVTVVGHSLGAHVVGLAAHYAKGVVNYAVGLDPALPGFVTATAGYRIASGDAENVEIIHTNAGHLGYVTAIGDIDFYPNGGARQRGCGFDMSGVCSHARAYHYFAESINTPVGFHAKYCKKYLLTMLGFCSSSITTTMGGSRQSLMYSGKFHLKTNKWKPFARGP